MCGAEKSERPVLGEAYDVRRPQDFGPRCLAKRCAVSDLCTSANSAGPFVREAYDVRQ